MKEPLLIVGQGLAGTLLGWECERAGLPFVMADAGLGGSASRVGAGMINPVTGRRWSKSWRVDEWRGPALAVYREIEATLGLPLLREMKVRRLFRDESERNAVKDKVARGALSPYLTEVDENGAWIHGAAQVDTAALVTAMRLRWAGTGRLEERRVDLAAEQKRYRRTILCGGAEVSSAFPFVPWELAWGEVLAGELPGLDPGTILNRGHWILPEAGGRARVGATYERAEQLEDRPPSLVARAELEQSARLLAGGTLAVDGQEGGWRVTVPDRHPCVGVHPDVQTLGVMAGLGSKGTLWAPELARLWARFLQGRTAFPDDLDVARYWTGG